MRDPRDAYASRKGGRGLPQPTPQAYVAFRNSIAEQGATAPPERVRLVRYEDLVDALGVVVRQLCSFLGLRDDLPGTPRARPAPLYHGRGDHDRAGAAITLSSVGKWQGAFPVETARLIVRGCGPAVAPLGYWADGEVVPASAAPMPT